MTETEKTQLRGFVEYYVSAYNELTRLEEELQSLGERKEALSERIKTTKDNEEKLMQSLRIKYGEKVNDPRYLMKMLGINQKDLFDVK